MSRPRSKIRRVNRLYSSGQKKICMFPIAWSSKLGWVGRDLKKKKIKLLSNFSKDVDR
jgi:hypothetical protein